MHTECKPKSSSDMWLVNRIFPRLVMSAMPTNCATSLSDTLFDSIRHNFRIFIEFFLCCSLFTQVWSNIHFVSDFHPILSPEFNGIHFQIKCNVFHMGFQTEESLRGPVSSICSGHGNVRVHDVTIETFVITVV